MQRLAVPFLTTRLDWNEAGITIHLNDFPPVGSFGAELTSGGGLTFLPETLNLFPQLPADLWAATAAECQSRCDAHLGYGCLGVWFGRSATLKFEPSAGLKLLN